MQTVTKGGGGGTAAILISDKIHFKSKMVTKDKEGNYIIIKESIHQEDIVIIYTCTQHQSTYTYKANIDRSKG